MATYIFTGRFQPLHKGHIKFLEEIKKRYPNDLLVICIIRNSKNTNSFVSESEFHKMSKIKQIPENNPLPNWNRYMLLSLAVNASSILKHNTEIVFRSRSDVDWDESVVDLPEDRIWVFPKYEKETFDVEKHRYYQSKNEVVEYFDFYDDNKMYSASQIRSILKNQEQNIDLSFLPEACVEYFRAECLKYFA